MSDTVVNGGVKSDVAVLQAEIKNTNQTIKKLDSLIDKRLNAMNKSKNYQFNTLKTDISTYNDAIVKANLIQDEKHETFKTDQGKNEYQASGDCDRVVCWYVLFLGQDTPRTILGVMVL